MSHAPRTPRPARPARAGLVSVLVALCGLLVACGDDDTPSADPTTSTSPAATSSPPSPSSPSPTETPEQTETPEPAAPSQDTVPTSYDVAAVLLDGAPGPARRVNRFQTPGGGVWCILESDFVPTSCELAQGATVPAPDVCGSDGPSDAVGRVELTDGRPRPVCNSDTIREGNARDLQVGQTTSIGDLPVRCLAQSVGLTCVDDDARSGFFLGDGRYEVF